MPGLTRWSGRAYGALLRVMPSVFREAYGAEAKRAFEERIEATQRRRGLFVAAVSAVVGLLDLLRRIPAEWLSLAGEPKVGKGSRPPWLEGATRDLSRGVRSLARSWPLSLAIVLTLSLGIGANAAVFSVVNAVLLRPLSHPESDEIMTLGEVNPGIDIEPRWASPDNFADWKESAVSFESMALFRGRSMSLTGEGPAQYAYGSWVTSEFFDVFGAVPALGRGMVPEDGTSGSEDVVVLSHALWSGRYGRDPEVVGSTIEVDGVPRSVVGVMSEGFDAPSRWIGPGVRVLLWLPFPMDRASPWWGRDNRSYHVVGRLADGVGKTAAQEELTAVQTRLTDAYPVENRDWLAVVTPWREILVGGSRTPLLLLLASSGLVLLIAAGNVAGLLLNRMLGRLPEVAVRTALGGTRWRMARMILAEALLLALMGAAGGLVAARGALGLLDRLEPGRLPLADLIGLDGTVIALAVGLSLLLGLVTGVLPAALMARDGIARGPMTPGRSIGASYPRLRRSLAAGQLALAFALLVSAGLVTRSFRSLMEAPRGFEAEGVMTASVVLSWDRVSTLEERGRFVGSVLEELTRIPGVTSAGMVNSLPLSGSNAWQPFTVEGMELDDPTRPPAASFRGVSPGYFETMGIPMVRGRGFDAGDMENPGVALVNEAFVQRYLAGLDPIGRVVAISGGGPSFTVVGVVGDVRHRGLHMEADPEIYQPYTVETLSSKTFVVRSEVEPVGLAAAIRAAIEGVDPDQPVREIRPMQGWVEEAGGEPMFNAAMMGAASGLALVLALIGLFGVVSVGVTERAGEFGLRMALGAEHRGILSLVLKQGAVLALVGLGLGGAMAVAAGRLLEGVLYGVRPLDPATYVLAGLVFLGVTLLACYLPARRAAGVDPVETFRR